MQKYLIIALIFIVAGLLSSCQSEQNDYLEFHLKGAVKEMRLLRYKAQEIDGKIIKKRLVSEALDGPQLYEYVGTPPNCKLTFDRAGMIEVLGVYLSTGELDYELRYSDTMYAMYSPDGAFQAHIGVDDRSRPHYLKTYLKTGELANKVEVVYHAATGQSATHTEYNHQGELVGVTKYFYDDPLLKRVETQAHQKSNFHPKKQFRLEKIKYDEYEHPIKIVIDDGGLLKEITITYVLDEQNNWIQALEYVNGELEYFVERKLTYYE